MREAGAEKDDSHDDRNQRQGRRGCGTGRARRAGESELEEGASHRKSAPQAKKSAKGAKAKAGAAKREDKATRTQKGATEPRGNRKAEVIAMMKRATGATLADIMDATSWQPHIVRGFVSLLGSKGGEKVESSKNAAGEQRKRRPGKRPVLAPFETSWPMF